MNPCREHRADIHLSLDEQLGGRAHAFEFVCAHLAGCPDCRKHVEERQALSRLSDRSHRVM
jgi:hypothetical protein